MNQNATSWIEYDPCTEQFPLQNLPYGVMIHPTAQENPSHLCTRVGCTILDLHNLSKCAKQAGGEKLFPNELRALVGDSLEEPTWNGFMGRGKAVWCALRTHLMQILSKDCAVLRDDKETVSQCIHDAKGVRMVLPAAIGDYTDFYSSKEHATNLGKMFRPDQAPLLPNWSWIPVGYHGRASSIVVSGEDIARPSGQSKTDPNATVPVFGPSQRVDMEVEVAAWVGCGNDLGTSISEDDALDHIFGLSIFNDWSARDIQPWEYVPLGPFLAKNFASTISPWIVSLLALEPFQTAAPVQDPEPLPYLKRSRPDKSAFDIELTANFVLSSGESMQVTKTNYKSMYWTLSQQVAHHTVNGCNLRPGDVLASGTISGTEKSSWGSLIEITNRGQEKITFPSGETRTFVQDGDEIVLQARCHSPAVPYMIGFGQAAAKIVAKKK